MIAKWLLRYSRAKINRFESRPLVEVISKISYPKSDHSLKWIFWNPTRYLNKYVSYYIEHNKLKTITSFQTIPTKGHLIYKWGYSSLTNFFFFLSRAYFTLTLLLSRGKIICASLAHLFSFQVTSDRKLTFRQG